MTESRVSSKTYVSSLDSATMRAAWEILMDTAADEDDDAKTARASVDVPAPKRCRREDTRPHPSSLQETHGPTAWVQKVLLSCEKMRVQRGLQRKSFSIMTLCSGTGAPMIALKDCLLTI